MIGFAYGFCLAMFLIGMCKLFGGFRSPSPWPCHKSDCPHMKSDDNEGA